MKTMNYANMNEADKKRYDALFDKICGKSTASVKLFDGEEPYFELRLNKRTEARAERVRTALNEFGYIVADEYECEGSDYPSYCIWFKNKED